MDNDLPIDPEQKQFFRPPNDEVRPLLARSDKRGLSRLVIHLALLAMTASFVVNLLGTSAVTTAMFAHGIVLVFLFCPLHEMIHRTVFKTRFLNDGIAWVLGLVLFLPSEGFRHYHLAHHRFTQDPDRDPELIGGKPAGRLQYLAYITGLTYWIDRLGDFWQLIRAKHLPDWIPGDARAAAVSQARLYVVIYIGALIVSVLLQTSWLFWLWVLPLLVGQPAVRAFLFAEHTGCSQSADMLKNSRTMIGAGAVVRFLTWNMSFHAEHHLNPSIPFFSLPAYHHLVAEQIEQLDRRGYIQLNVDWFKSVKSGTNATNG